MSTTGERIRELRLSNHLTLEDVAKYLGVGRQAIYKYEQGTVTNIPLENLEKMSALFGTTPGYLAGWSENDPPVSEHVVIENMDQFGHIMQYMDREDYDFVIAAFDRAYKKMKDKGVKL